ncbi:MAG: DNA polymerase IV [Bdellovibrionaceae bacterium]|nr:DNA polymerase IV [Pseudobdellovibrionaceae bacterium]
MSFRRILHIDMDAFFASVEQHDFPNLRGKPVAVGGLRQGRGVISAASYEARIYGVHSAMPSQLALKRCPQLLLVPPRFDRYREVSHAVFSIFKSYTDLVEPLSLDEAYLDLSLELRKAKVLAEEIQSRIFKKTGLTASVGAAPNKFLAKIASDLEKPNGITIIYPSQVEKFVSSLAVRKILGVGPSTQKRLESHGIFTTADVRARSSVDLQSICGKFGKRLFELAHGKDHRSVQTGRTPRSRGCETTFEKDQLDFSFLVASLERLVERLELSLKKRDLRARTLTLKIRYADFETKTRSLTLGTSFQSSEEMMQSAFALLQKTEAGDRPVRLLGLSASGFENKHSQPQLDFTFD